MYYREKERLAAERARLKRMESQGKEELEGFKPKKSVKRVTETKEEAELRR